MFVVPPAAAVAVSCRAVIAFLLAVNTSTVSMGAAPAWWLTSLAGGLVVFLRRHRTHFSLFSMCVNLNLEYRVHYCNIPVTHTIDRIWFKPV